MHYIEFLNIAINQKLMVKVKILKQNGSTIKKNTFHIYSAFDYLLSAHLLETLIYFLF